MDSGWKGMDALPSGGEDGPIITWHRYSGVLVELRSRATENQFITHWREIDHALWISAADRKPGRADADIYSCVVSLNCWGEVSMAGWHRFAHETDLLYWQHPPDPPDCFSKLRTQK